MTDLTIHRAIVVREFYPALLRCCRYNTAPFSVIATQRFRVSRLLVVVRRKRINAVDRLRNFPTHIRRHARLLKEFASFPDKSWTERCVAGVGQINLSDVAAGG